MPGYRRDLLGSVSILGLTVELAAWGEDCSLWGAKGADQRVIIAGWRR